MISKTLKCITLNYKKEKHVDKSKLIKHLEYILEEAKWKALDAAYQESLT